MNSIWYKNSVAVVLLGATLSVSAMNLPRFASSRCIVPAVAALAYGYHAIKPITIFAESSDLKKQKSHDEIGAAAARAGVKLALVRPEEYAWRVQRKEWHEANQLNKILQEIYCGITLSEHTAACRDAKEASQKDVMWHALDVQKAQKIAAEGIAETQALRKYGMPSAKVAENYGVRAAISWGKLCSHTAVLASGDDVVGREHQAARKILEEIQSVYCSEIPFECSKGRAYGTFLAHTTKKSGLSGHNTVVTETRVLINDMKKSGASFSQKNQSKPE